MSLQSTPRIERDAFDFWLRQDLLEQHGRPEALPDLLLVLIEAAALPH